MSMESLSTSTAAAAQPEATCSLTHHIASGPSDSESAATRGQPAARAAGAGHLKAQRASAGLAAAVTATRPPTRSVNLEADSESDGHSRFQQPGQPEWQPPTRWLLVSDHESTCMVLPESASESDSRSQSASSSLINLLAKNQADAVQLSDPHRQADRDSAAAARAGPRIDCPQRPWPMTRVARAAPAAAVQTRMIQIGRQAKSASGGRRAAGRALFAWRPGNPSIIDSSTPGRGRRGSLNGHKPVPGPGRPGLVT